MHTHTLIRSTHSHTQHTHTHAQHMQTLNTLNTLTDFRCWRNDIWQQFCLILYLVSALSTPWIGVGGVEICIHTYLTLALDGNVLSASRHGHICTHWMGSWVGYTTMLDVSDGKNLLPLPGFRNHYVTVGRFELTSEIRYWRKGRGKDMSDGKTRKKKLQ